LNDANLLLQRVLESSTGNLARLQEGVTEQTGAYTAAVRDALAGTEQSGAMMAQQVEGLRETVRGMLDEFGEISTRLRGETDGFQSAAAVLAETSNATVDTLENRREAMDALAASFAERTQDIDARLRGFAQSIADTVNQTERRLIAARKAMEEALESTSSAVGERLTGFSAIASTESARAEAAVREAQQRLLADIERAYAEA